MAVRAGVGGASLRRAALAVVCALVLAAQVAATQAARAADEAAPAVAKATGSAALETAIIAEKLVVEGGTGGRESRRWVPARRLDSGDEVHYTVRVHNPGKVPVTDVVVTKRLPFGVRYQAGSASGPACEIQLSPDGGRSFVVPGQGPSVPTGKARRSLRRPVTHTVEYSHVRWLLSKPLAPGATALLRFRATFS